MSYLSQCEQIRAGVWRITWHGAKGTVYTTKDHPTSVTYRRHSVLGMILRNNTNGERRFIADAIEQQTGARPTDWKSV